jgi:hypothetical protein
MYEAALGVCPDILLHHSDEYLAALINKLSESGKHKDIFVVCGYGQSRTIPFHLYHNPRVFQDDALSLVSKFNDPFETLVRRDSPEIIADKLAIVDQMFND